MNKLEFQFIVKNLSDINIGDIVFFNLDDTNLPLNRYAIISKVNESLFVGLDLDNHLKIENLILDPDDDFYILGNLNELLSNKKIIKKPNRYFWLGIIYENYRILICIEDKTVEYIDINSKNSQWSSLDLDEDVIEDSNNSIYVSIPNTNINFFINLNENKVKIFNEKTKRYKIYSNCKLAKANEAVFNSELDFN